MIAQESLLVTLVRLVDRLPEPPSPTKRGRGRPKVYPDRLFLKALVIMIVRHLHKVHELLTVLDQPTPEMQTLRALLTENGRYPSRRTWERRLKAMPDTLPAQIGCLRRYLVALIQAWAILAENRWVIIGRKLTGQTHRGKGITKQGHRDLRRALIKATWVAVQKSPRCCDPPADRGERTPRTPTASCAASLLAVKAGLRRGRGGIASRRRNPETGINLADF